MPDLTELLRHWGVGLARFQANHGGWFSATPCERPTLPRLTRAAELANLAASSALFVPIGQAARTKPVFGNQLIMQNMIRHRIGTSFLFASLALVIGPAAALAQSGSTGGSIGNDEKSLSGSRSAEPERPARRSKPEAEEPRRSTSRRGGGGGGGNFDGAWMVVSTGTTCSGSSTTAVIVTSGKIIGQGLTGSVSPSGAAHSVGNYDGIIVTSSGHVSGRSGSGTFKRSDGCVGRWASSKQ